MSISINENNFRKAIAIIETKISWKGQSVYKGTHSLSKSVKFECIFTHIISSNVHFWFYFMLWLRLGWV